MTTNIGARDVQLPADAPPASTVRQELNKLARAMRIIEELTPASRRWLLARLSDGDA